MECSVGTKSASEKVSRRESLGTGVASAQQKPLEYSWCKTETAKDRLELDRSVWVCVCAKAELKALTLPHHTSWFGRDCSGFIRHVIILLDLWFRINFFILMDWIKSLIVFFCQFLFKTWFVCLYYCILSYLSSILSIKYRNCIQILKSLSYQWKK